MRNRSARPFIKEVRGGRLRREGRPIALQANDPNDIFSGDERQPRDIRDDDFSAAMKAADRLFDPGSDPQPFIDDEPPPRAPVMQIDRPLQDNDTVGHEDARSSDARSSAEAFFKKPEFVEQPQPVATEPDTSKPRVLVDLSEGPDELTLRLKQAEGVRRGRKPGSKNKPKITVADDFPKIASTKVAEKQPRQDVPTPSLFEVASHDDTDVLDRPQVAIMASTTSKALVSKVLVYKPRAEKTTFKPGERWKRRLRHLR